MREAQKITSLLFALASAIPGMLPAGAWAETTRVPLADIAQTIDTCIRGSRIRLNNYAGPAGPNFYKPNDSTVQLSACLGGGQIAFNIPEVVQRVPTPGGELGLRIYVNDVILSRAVVTSSSTGISVTLSLENRGVEVKGHCFGAGCNVIPGGVLNIDATSADLRINLVPEKFGNDVSFGNVQASLQAVMTVTGLVGPLNALANTAIGQLQNALSAAAADAVANVMMQQQVRAATAAALRVRLNQLGVKNVNSVQVTDGQLVIEHGAVATEPPAVAGALTTFRVAVDVHSLLPEVAKIRVICVVGANTLDNRDLIGQGINEVAPNAVGSFNGQVPVAVMPWPGRTAADLQRATKYACHMQLIHTNGVVGHLMVYDPARPPWTVPKPGTPFTWGIEGPFPPPE